MQPSSDMDSATATAAGSGVLRKWLNPRRKRLWALVLLFLYTTGGFFLAPLLVESRIIATARDDFGREATIERVRVNPFVLSLEIRGFALIDPDGVTLAGCERFFVNLQLSSLAMTRAQAIRDAFLAGGGFDEARIAIGEPVAVESPDPEWVVMELGVAAN